LPNNRSHDEDTMQNPQHLRWNRREFLTFMGLGALAGGTAGWLTSCATISGRRSGSLFTPIRPNREDALVLHPDLRSRIFLREGQPINSQGATFGCNNDYTAFIGLNGSSTDGMFWVNHEYFHHLLLSGRNEKSTLTAEQFAIEQKAVGGSLVRIRRNADTGAWEPLLNDPLNRRWDAQTPIPLAAPRPIAGRRVAIGTLANCAGGITPWGSFLTCEENFHDYWGDFDFDKEGKRTPIEPWKAMQWVRFAQPPPEHYGWVVEIDGRSGTARKLTAMGRFAHEGATVGLARDGRAVAYMGDDKANECIYKFVSDRPGSLTSGELFVADTVNGRWLSLDIKKQKILQQKFKDQTDVLISARYAARLVGGTPQDRPEDVEICPRTGAVYVTLTNNKNRGNLYGSILKIEEAEGDRLAREFKASTFLAGGTESGFACPDNLTFDHQGNLWITSDISTNSMNKGEYATFGNNGLFFVPMSGAHAGEVYQVASAPRDAELTGPTFSPDGRTLFLSVQHPGEESEDLGHLTSHWPDGGSSLPRSAVVAIEGQLLDRFSAKTEHRTA
jgi:secreted PhoX family phosphatase